ncbi:LURP-one-related/scramblase family protein [Paramaledivibacter caminithermalis]|uniref:Uncharacterized protein YxjI n=1 Tax=Paramaledivibacter caminithermalis (strain DSM 15212 / CIP 107654 / DViRD3) TaxID=1121301 RepID=A0A1M6QWM7_PARC5|nr:LURP-one-related family protein [Paramaledivibacter caminithermalis]SHK24477.1 Uncharacterized protein YxjI [Paramaledivibacter caminithermalis DSM 15212]
MKYMIKQKIFSLRTGFNIKNEFEEDIYSVKGEVFSLGKKLRLYDIEGKELVYIEQELFNFLPVYKIYIDGKIIAKIKKKFTLFRTELSIESNGKEYTLEGDFLAHEYRILSQDRVIANISKEWFSFGDTYGVEISDAESHPFILALVIVLDQACHEGR